MNTKSNPNPKKVEIVKKLAEMIKSAKSVVFVDYTGLDVKSQQALKKELKKVGSDMLVTKNTLLKLALSENKQTDEVLQGQTAVIFSNEDAVASIQVIGKFAKEHELPTFKSGFVENVFQDKTNLEKISLLPSKDELLGQTVGTIASPLYSLINSLQGNLQKLVYILSMKGGVS